MWSKLKSILLQKGQNYEKCLKQVDSRWCLPNLEQKSEDCEVETWDKLQEKFAKPNDIVSPCPEFSLDDLILGTGFSFNQSDINIDLGDIVLTPVDIPIDMGDA